MDPNIILNSNDNDSSEYSAVNNSQLTLVSSATITNSINRKKHGKCTKCGKRRRCMVENPNICQFCYLGVSSGIKHVDDFIKGTLVNRIKLQWIPFRDLKITKKIGQGGFSKVFKATWKSRKIVYKEKGVEKVTEIIVALKILNDSSEADLEFLRERPTIENLFDQLYVKYTPNYSDVKKENELMVEKAEEKRKQMIELGIPFVKDSGKEHSNANYTSSLLTPLITTIKSRMSSFDSSGGDITFDFEGVRVKSEIISKKHDRDEWQQSLQIKEENNSKKICTRE
ncbi:5973_t:CDS:2 [Acaulospora morrowiae]|uniref:5973_t:CDS:1 n=1 Tax=Acaulospora morrowiae TaxID=94023 RepID=A0A9N9FR83_9GLOM|nr:5973_t:CDS:2 [Acaulospora morrowiae]